MLFIDRLARRGPHFIFHSINIYPLRLVLLGSWVSASASLYVLNIVVPSPESRLIFWPHVQWSDSKNIILSLARIDKYTRLSGIGVPMYDTMSANVRQKVGNITHIFHRMYIYLYIDETTKPHVKSHSKHLKSDLDIFLQTTVHLFIHMYEYMHSVFRYWHVFICKLFAV